MSNPASKIAEQFQLFIANPANLPSRPRSATGVKERGAVFTRRETVDFILDLAGYMADKSLDRFKLLEPSLGNGVFLFAAVERLLVSYCNKSSDLSRVVEDLSGAITAVEVDEESIVATSIALVELLIKAGVTRQDAGHLVQSWIVCGDFLLADFKSKFHFVVGNPPYVRQELIPDDLMAEYRNLYATIYDRADLYVPFIERSLGLLEEDGALGFICADRWMKNRYGGPLRAMVARGFHLKYYVDMVDTDAFESEVSAYPAITVITKEKPGLTRLAHRPTVDQPTLQALSTALQAEKVAPGSGVTEIVKAVNGTEPWILNSFDQLALVRRLEQQYPTLEEARCNVGIGVATGADKAYIGPFDELDVEPKCKLPLVTTKDIKNGKVEWQGLGVINPFTESGPLVDLATHPKLAGYLEKRSEVILKRNCAQKNPKNWYRTIDRISPELTYVPKLLVPDIKGEASIVYEEGKLYPHHNLYYITSQQWDLRALQAVLQSGIAKLFVAIYSTQMRGGYLRFQAQYLRRIRVPRWSDVSEAMRKRLSEAALAGDKEACNKATFELYALTDDERGAIGGNGD